MKIRIGKRTQLEIAILLILLGMYVLSVRNIQYATYKSCDRRYSDLMHYLLKDSTIADVLQQPEHERVKTRISLFHPSGYMYAGYNALLGNWAIGAGLVILGVLIGLDTLRKSPFNDKALD